MTETTSYRCEVCGLSFTSSEQASRHELVCHLRQSLERELGTSGAQRLPPALADQLLHLPPLELYGLALVVYEAVLGRPDPGRMLPPARSHRRPAA